MCVNHQCCCFSLHWTFRNYPLWRLINSDGHRSICHGSYARNAADTWPTRNGGRIPSPLSDIGERRQKHVICNLQLIPWSGASHCTSLWLNSESVYWVQTHHYSLSSARLRLRCHIFHFRWRRYCLQNDIQELYTRRLDAT